MHHRLTGKPSV